jgi:hypothetical protein
MKKHYKTILGMLCLLFLIGLTGCGHKQTLSGVYRSNDAYNKEDDGTIQPSYYYFKKNGTFMYCSPQVNSVKGDDSYFYGDVSRGTWKALGHNQFQIKMRSVYDDDHYSFKAQLNGKRLHTDANAKDAKFRWSADNNTKVDMNYDDYMAMFKKARVSAQKGIQQDGYMLPDNPTVNDVANNPKLVGALVLANGRGINALKHQKIEFMIMKKANTYQAGFGTKDGTLNYTIDGKSVTIKDGSDYYKRRKTTTVDSLMKNYYSSNNDKEIINDVVDNMHVTDMSDD